MPETRIVNRSSHKLINIITIAVLAVLCGADGWVAVETYGKAKKDWLSKFLDLSNGIPSHDTFGRVFSKIDPEKMESHFQGWVKLMAGKLGLTVVSIDGKSLNGSYDRENSLNALQMVSAWSSNHDLVLGQCTVEKKSNEIRAIPVLLEQLDLKGVIVTMDAMGTQRTIAQQIKAAEADYILALKGNHPTLNNEAQDWFKANREKLEAVPVAMVFLGVRIKQWQGLQTFVIVLYGIRRPLP